jgi:hypothetical protein
MKQHYNIYLTLILSIFEKNLEIVFHNFTTTTKHKNFTKVLS